MGGLLIGLSTFQAEFDFGVPQFSLVFHPVLIAVAAGIALEWIWPGDFGYRLGEGGPTLPVWIAAGGAGLAVVLAVALRNRLPTIERTDWMPAAACALFVLPLVVTGGWERPTPAQELNPGLVAALRDATSPGDVVLADPETSYWISANVPVYVAVSAPSHVGDTTDNRPYERVALWEDYLRGRAFPGRVDWVVLDRQRVRNRGCAPTVYEDARYLFCASTQSR
jgi:hypothetical protein